MPAKQSSAVHPLVKDHADLIAKFASIVGTDQSAAGKRAAVTRRIRAQEVNLLIEGIDGWETFIPPTKVKQTGGFDDAGLLKRIEGLERVLAIETITPDQRKTAQSEHEQRTRQAQERGLIAPVAA
jgi:hypothetical protein